MNSINAVSMPVARATSLRAPNASSEASEGGGFGDAVKRVLDNTNNRLLKADAKVQDYMAGKDVPIHNVMMELSQAELSLKLTSAVATKVIQAYQEVTRMQL